MDQDVIVEAKFLVRPAEPDDFAFIFSTWLKSYRYNNQDVSRVPAELYYRKHHEVIARLRDRCALPVACLPDSPAVIIGFAALELPPALLNTSSLPPPAPAPPVIHWVYVKRAWRRMGVATRLLGQLSPSACCHSHWTSAIHPWAHVKWSGLRYDPYLQVTPQS